MGACCSKINNTAPSTPTPTTPEIKTKPNPQQPENKNNTPVAIVASPTEQQTLKKDAFLVKHRKSQEIDTHPDQQTRKSVDRNKTPNSGKPQLDETNSAGACGVPTDESGKVVGAMVRTSSCTKEEVDAILIQCGRLSRSSSGVKPAGGETPTRGRRYSGSKRSFDFDMEMDTKNDDDPHHRRQQREPRVSSPSRRRRSRERDPQQQRSGSKERGSGTGTGGRRVSRSPNRRSESPNPNIFAAGGGTNRPGKMVSVPATDKSNNAGGGEVVASVSGGVNMNHVKRGEPVGATGSRSAGTARSRSPSKQNLRVLNENQNQQAVTPSRSNRRNPLCEIDTNAVGSEQSGSKKPNGEKMNNKAKETQMQDETKTSAENPKHNQIVSRTQSSRLSRDLDISLETLMNPNPNPNLPSYASLLLEDIQNFHHKNPALPVCKTGGILVESEKVVNDDVMEPSLHKYVTVRRGGDADAEEQESSGSNSFAGSQQLSWMSSSWEPNSGDSTDCWTSKLRSDAGDMGVERSGEYPRNGVGRGRVGVHRRSAYSLPNNATVDST